MPLNGSRFYDPHWTSPFASYGIKKDTISKKILTEDLMIDTEVDIRLLSDQPTDKEIVAIISNSIEHL